MAMTRSGKRTGANKRRNASWNNLPENIQRIILLHAASGPMQARKVGAISKGARNVTKYKRAAGRINKARWAYITSGRTRGEYLHNNIPHRLGQMAERMGNNQGIGSQYRIRENIKRNFRNRILPKGPTNINNQTRYYENNTNTYILDRNGILRRTKTTVNPGAARYVQYIGKI
jgi:hypothetical protein